MGEGFYGNFFFAGGRGVSKALWLMIVSILSLSGEGGYCIPSRHRRWLTTAKSRTTWPHAN